MDVHPTKKRAATMLAIIKGSRKEKGVTREKTQRVKSAIKCISSHILVVLMLKLNLINH
jgi:hypothetical protein